MNPNVKTNDVKDAKNGVIEASNVTTKKTTIIKPKIEDFNVIIAPIITEKTMSLKTNKNQVVFKVKSNANKINIKLAFERLFHVKVTNVSVINVNAKRTTRGSRYNGTISGYKKAIITIAKGETINLFGEE